MDLEVISLFPS